MKTPATAELKFHFNVPNTVTAVRVVLTVVVAVLLLQGGNTLLAGIFLVVASLTDWADGFLARRLKQTGLFGSLFDMVSDQFLFMTTLVLAVGAGLFDRVEGLMPFSPYPYVVVTLAGGITALAGIAIFLVKRRNREISFPTPTLITKINFWFWLIPLILAVFGIGPDLLLAILMYLAIITTLMSFYSYLRKGSYVFTD